MANVMTTPPTRPATIVLEAKNGLKTNEGRVKTAKTIYPGMLIERLTDTGYQYMTVQPHATAGGAAELLIAIELALVADIPGATYSGGTVDDAYAAGDLVRWHHCQRGDVVHALVAASASAIVMTDWLSSNGDGCLRKETSTGVKLFAPMEAVDNSAGSSRARIRARAL